MQEGKVKIADGFPETKDRLKKFQADYNLGSNDGRLSTLGDTIDKLIEIATVKVPALESALKEKEQRIEELEKKEE